MELVKDYKEAKFITHAGTMHADEVFATAFLDLYFKDIKVIRMTKLPTDIEEDVIVYDIGRGRFDHHQPDRLVRENNIPYCAFGLLWDAFGRKYLESIGIEDIEEVWHGIDKELVEGIDAIDNGIFPKFEADYKIRNLCDIIKLFNPSYESGEEENTQFIKAVELSKVLFEEYLLNVKSKVIAKKKVSPKIEEAIKKHYLELDEYMPYEETVTELDEKEEIYFVVYPSNRGGWGAKTINKREEKTQRLPFPEEWAGLDSELEKVCGVKGATFCHLGRFIISAKTKEAVIEMVEKTINLTK